MVKLIEKQMGKPIKFLIKEKCYDYQKRFVLESIN